jgi:regulatory protein YycH of two-component signal transduction system YycFG
MWERVKTGILSALVGLSLILTFIIWTSVPTNTPADQPTVLSTVSWPEKTVNQLVYPDQIVAHLGDSKHTVLYPNSTGYSLVLKDLQKATIYDMKPIAFSDDDWKRAISGKCLELNFSWNIPFDAINQMFPGIKLIEPKPNCQTMLIEFDNQMQNSQIIFLTKGLEPASYAASLGVPTDSIANLFQYLQSKEPSYLLYGSSMSQSYYLPKDPIELPVYTYRLDTINEEQLINTFFVDPSMTKKIDERDGSYIKTDGSRGVRFIPQLNRIQYTDPATDWKDDQLPQIKQISKAIAFTSDHGGIEGEAQLVMADPYLYGPGATYYIQDYLNGLPVTGNLGQVLIQLQGDQVVEFERSIQYLGKQIAANKKSILPASKLIAILTRQSHISLSSIVQIKLEYQPVTIDKQQVEFDPVYQIVQSGNTRFVNAVTGDTIDRRNKNGLE